MIDAPARNYSPWYAWMVRLMATEVPDTLTAARLGEWPQWRQRCSERLEHLLGRLPEPVDPRFETLDSVPCGAYRRDKVVFDTEAAMSVPAYLLVPESREVPGDAVLAIHGHGPGKDHACGLVETETPGGDYAHQLALAATSSWRRTCAASASGRTGTHRTTTRATPTSCTPSWTGGARSPRTSGT